LLKLFPLLPGYLLETMKTVGKRINPAFTVVQPLPLWPVAVAVDLNRRLTSDDLPAAPRLTTTPERVIPISQPRSYATALPSAHRCQ